jgi:hypothetical protein
VPGDHVPGIADALLHLYHANAESLHQRVDALIRDEASPEGLHEARAELGALEHAIDQLGWDRRAPDGPVEVVAERAVLRQAILAAIDEAGDRLNRHCTALLRGDGSEASIVAGIGALEGLLALLRETDGR